jgi:hypothetical protein
MVSSLLFALAHASVATITGNPLIVLAIATLVGLVRRPRTKRYKRQRADWREYMREHGCLCRVCRGCGWATTVRLNDTVCITCKVRGWVLSLP